jgi:hypothetical protein
MSDLTPEDEALLGRARLGLEATDADRERVKSKLFAQIGIGTLAATKSTAAATTLLAGASTKVIAGVGIAVLMIGGSIAIHRVLAPARSPSAALTTSIPIASSSAAPPASSEATAALTATMPVSSSAPSANVVASAAIAVPAPNAHASSPEDHSSAIAARASDPVAASTVSTSSTAPTSTQSPAAIANAPSTMTAPAATGPTLDAEIALIQGAADALKKGEPGRALALAERHRSQFPNGTLAEERDVERVLALCALGRVAEAHDLAQSFLAAHPNSPQAERVRASCAGAP